MPLWTFYKILKILKTLVGFQDDSDCSENFEAQILHVALLTQRTKRMGDKDQEIRNDERQDR